MYIVFVLPQFRMLELMGGEIIQEKVNATLMLHFDVILSIKISDKAHFPKKNV